MPSLNIQDSKQEKNKIRITKIAKVGKKHIKNREKYRIFITT